MVLSLKIKGQGHNVEKCKIIFKAIEWWRKFALLSSGRRLVFFVLFSFFVNLAYAR